MNPYDFVPLDTLHQPDLRTPVWHHVLKESGAGAGKLYSGHLTANIKTETPLFIPDTEAVKQDPNNPAEHIFNNAGKYIIPGSSLKGLLRTVVETLCSGCLSVIQLPVGYAIPQGFASCQDKYRLCIACRIFGMMQDRQRNAVMFLGKINIGDALTVKGTLGIHDPIYTAILEAPKPRHSAFYLDAKKRYIAGRKFYFHHHGRLNTEDRLVPIRNEPGKYRNQYIEPIDTGTEFSTRIDFTNLVASEFAALLLALTLKPTMRHKIGYGKPIGLGSVHITLTDLCLVDYATRYTNFHASRGFSNYNTQELANLVRDQMAAFDPHVHAAWHSFYEQPSLDHLQAIWKWQPDNQMIYKYPRRDWFDTHPQARIAETWNL